MKHVFGRSSVAMSLAVVGAVWLLQTPVATQYGPGKGVALTDNAPTPRTADGHPDMSGMWGGRGGGGGGPKPDENGNLTIRNKQRPCSAAQVAAKQCGAAVNFERDSGVEQRDDENMPQYKPELWEKVQLYDREGADYDPEFNCKPSGVPRMGPPNKIIQTPTELVMLYQAGNLYRVIPIDGRPHDPIKSQDTTWYGDAVGKWEGDTLAIDIVGFNDESWLDWPGWFHSNNMHVIERLTRKGNTLTWQVTVDDPDSLLKPWEMEPHSIRLNPDPKATLNEDLPCEERDKVHLVTKERG